ncbi:MAG TPA: hypothetical protein VIU13_13570, partial [Chryseolinea sp.]
PSVTSLIDSLKQQGFDVKSMKKGFPDISIQHAEPFVSYWEMVDNLPIESLNEVIVVSYSLTSKFRGKRISLPENVTWISKEPGQKEFALSAIRFSNDSVLVRMGKSSSQQTSFTNLTERIDQSAQRSSISSVPVDTLRLAIYADPDYEYDRRIIMAALRAIENTMPVVFNTSIRAPAEKQGDNNIDWTIWLSRKDAGHLNTNSILLREDLNENSPLLIQVKTVGEKQWQITKRLNEETALKEQLALNLSFLLLKSDLIQARADSLDQTIQPEELLWSGNESIVSSASMRTVGQIDRYLLVAIIALLIIERFLAFKRNA